MAAIQKKYATFSQDRCLALARTCSFVFDLNKSALADVTTVKEMSGDETGFRVQRTALVRHQLDCEIRLLSSVKNKVGRPLKYVREDCLCFLKKKKLWQEGTSSPAMSINTFSLSQRKQLRQRERPMTEPCARAETLMM